MFPQWSALQGTLADFVTEVINSHHHCETPGDGGGAVPFTPKVATVVLPCHWGAAATSLLTILYELVTLALQPHHAWQHLRHYSHHHGMLACTSDLEATITLSMTMFQILALWTLYHWNYNFSMHVDALVSRSVVVLHMLAHQTLVATLWMPRPYTLLLMWQRRNLEPGCWCHWCLRPTAYPWVTVLQTLAPWLSYINQSPRTIISISTSWTQYKEPEPWLPFLEKNKLGKPQKCWCHCRHPQIWQFRTLCWCHPAKRTA